MPEATPGIIPLLTVEGADAAIAFYTNAFGAEEMSRAHVSDGRVMHCAMRINGGVLYISDLFPEHGSTSSPSLMGGTTVTMHIETADADELFARAIAAGATPIVPMADVFWGQRYGQLRDPFGHRWSIATPVDVRPREELETKAKLYFG